MPVIALIQFLTVSHLNAHPLRPSLKLLFKFTCYFGCSLMCILLSPSGDCYLADCVTWTGNRLSYQSGWTGNRLSYQSGQTGNSTYQINI